MIQAVEASTVNTSGNNAQSFLRRVRAAFSPLSQYGKKDLHVLMVEAFYNCNNAIMILTLPHHHCYNNVISCAFAT